MPLSLSSPHEFSSLSPLEKSMTKKNNISCEGDEKGSIGSFVDGVAMYLF